jgi:hypothetical protein
MIDFVGVDDDGENFEEQAYYVNDMVNYLNYESNTGDTWEIIHTFGRQQKSFLSPYYIDPGTELKKFTFKDSYEMNFADNKAKGVFVLARNETIYNNIKSAWDSLIQEKINAINDSSINLFSKIYSDVDSFKNDIYKKGDHIMDYLVTPNVNLYVSGGSNSPPYYAFYTDEANNTLLTPTNTLDVTKTYTFYRDNDATSHAFYIGDNGYESVSSNKITIDGDGSATSGITGSESFKLTFNDVNQYIDLSYYCTAHSYMINSFVIIYAELKLSDAPYNDTNYTGFDTSGKKFVTIEFKQSLVGFNLSSIQIAFNNSGSITWNPTLNWQLAQTNLSESNTISNVLTGPLSISEEVTIDILCIEDTNQLNTTSTLSQVLFDNNVILCVQKGTHDNWRPLTIKNE